jgi:mannose-6-phosphate isomerase-like protein (cupin superfamily)
MKGYVSDIEKATLENTDFRRVLYTTKRSQLVLMCVRPGEDIGMEVHPDRDQFLRFEQGEGKAVLDGVEHDIVADWAVVVPAGTQHNFINTGDSDLKLYTIYSPPEHKDGTVEHAKADVHEEHFDGVTTE